MFSSDLGKKLDKYHLLKHPFYQIYWNEGKLNRENGIKIKEAKMSDQPIKTTAFVLKAYFSMKFAESA